MNGMRGTLTLKQLRAALESSRPSIPDEEANVTTAAHAGGVAQGFMRIWMPCRLVCPSDEAEDAVIEALSAGAKENNVPVEVIDVRPAPAERLEAVTARVTDWKGRPETRAPDFVPTLLILRGFDVFGDKQHEDPTYPFRSDFQFDEAFRWVFLGRDRKRMSFLFNSCERPLYHAAMDITPAAWR